MIAAQLVLLVAAAFGVGIARYYVLVTWATVVSLCNYLRRGVPATWEVAEGTRGCVDRCRGAARGLASVVFSRRPRP